MDNVLSRFVTQAPRRHMNTLDVSTSLMAIWKGIYRTLNKFLLFTLSNHSYTVELFELYQTSLLPFSSLSQKLTINGS